MKTPTLKQLKKRPALWFLVLGDEDPSFVEPRITMPNGGVWIFRQHGFFFCGWSLHSSAKGQDWHNHALKHAIKNYEFGGWL